MLAEKVNEMVDFRVAVGASCFNGICRVYAPRYRQVNVTALVHLLLAPVLQKMPEQARRGIELAYSDVRRAFVHFIDDPATAGRPFFIAGHSQGSFHAARLLQEEVEGHPERLRRFVHAYLPGTPIPRDLFGRTLQHVLPSRSAHDVCSVSSWRTGGPGHRMPEERSGMRYYADSGWEESSAGFLNNNPITWSDERLGKPSDPKEYRGAAFPLASNVSFQDHAGNLSSGLNLRFGHLVSQSKDTLGISVSSLARIEVGNVTTHICKGGALRVPRFPKGSLFELCEGDYIQYHDVDIALFYGNLRENSVRRYEAWKGAACSKSPS